MFRYFLAFGLTAWLIIAAAVPAVAAVSAADRLSNEQIIRILDSRVDTLQREISRARVSIWGGERFRFQEEKRAALDYVARLVRYNDELQDALRDDDVNKARQYLRLIWTDAVSANMDMHEIVYDRFDEMTIWFPPAYLAQKVAQWGVAHYRAPSVEKALQRRYFWDHTVRFPERVRDGFAFSGAVEFRYVQRTLEGRMAHYTSARDLILDLIWFEELADTPPVTGRFARYGDSATARY